MTSAVEEYYNDLLDEQGEIEIGIYKFLPSQILKMCDPIAYHQGLLDFEDYLIENEELNR